MWIVLEDLQKVSSEDQAKDYKVVVTGPGGELALSSDCLSAGKVGPGVSFNTTSGCKAIWWTFNQEADKTTGTVTSAAMKEGIYTFQLKKAGENVGQPVTLEIGKLTITNGETNTIFFDKGANHKVSDLITVTDPTPAAGKVFKGWKAAEGEPVTTAQLNNTVLSADAAYEAVFENDTIVSAQLEKDEALVPGTTVAVELDKTAKTGTLTISGVLPYFEGEATFSLKYVLASGTTSSQNVGFRFVDILGSTGNFNLVAPAPTITVGEYTYTVQMGDLTLLDANKGVGSADAEVDIPDDLNSALTDNIGAEDGIAAGEGLLQEAGPALVETIKAVTAEQVTEYLKTANATV